MDRFWVKHSDQDYLSCTLDGSDEKGSRFKTDQGDIIVLSAKDAESLIKVSEDHLKGLDNICDLSEVSDVAVMNTVRTRYYKKSIYTRVARILIAVNPFQSLPIYGAEHLDRYAHAADSMDLQPHVYGLGLDAVNGLRRTSMSQAVLISGESGAGKTETTKLVLMYMAHALSGRSGIEDKIQQTSPVLEAFGNAMTVRNNNSSRFGKWLEISLSSTLAILGCTVTDYLLEATRVCGQNPAERGYHIFFQLIQGRNSSELKELGLQGPEAYQYLKGGQSIAPGINDADCFEEVKSAFTTLGFSEELRLEVFKVVAAILNIGNCDFSEEDEKASLIDSAPMDRAAELLAVDAAGLRKLVLNRNIVVGREVTEANLKLGQAKAARDSLARLLYGRCFKWLIARINATLAEDADSGNQWFGVLDIAGFESFEKNSLEQLFINLSNEHLQSHFNNHVFKMELEDYKNEGLTMKGAIDFQDNSEIVQLIDSKGGILPMLDDEGNVPKATDQSFVNKVIKTHFKHKKFKPSKFANACEFTIFHFAGPVVYTCTSFLEKNIDKPPEAAAALFEMSELSVVAEFFDPDRATSFASKGGASTFASQATSAQSFSSSGRSAKKAQTVAAGFRVSLKELMAKLGGAEPHFIRCVKPNAQKEKERFTPQLVMEQLTLSGVMEAVRIRQLGHSSRMLAKDFLRRYRCVLNRAQKQKVFGQMGQDDLGQARAFLAELPTALATAGGAELGDDEFAVGKTKIFGRTRGMQCLDKAHDLALSGYAVEVQRIWRGMQIRRLMKTVFQVMAELRAWSAAHPFYQKTGVEHSALASLKTSDAIKREVDALAALLTRAEGLPMKLPQIAPLEKTLRRMEQEAKTVQQLDALANTIDPVEIDAALARAGDLQLPRVAQIVALEERKTRLRDQLPLAKAMEEALSRDDEKQVEQVLAEVVRLGLGGGGGRPPEGWIPELNGADLTARIQLKVEEILEKRRKEEEDRRRAEEEERLRREQEELEAKRKKEEGELNFQRQKQEEETRKSAQELAAKQLKEQNELYAKREEELEVKRRREAQDLQQERQVTAQLGQAPAREQKPPPDLPPDPGGGLEAPLVYAAPPAVYAAPPPQLSVEEPQIQAPRRRRRNTITGLDDGGQSRLSDGIAEAMRELDAELLKARLAEATAQGMARGDLEAAEALLASLQSEAFLAERLREQRDRVMVESPEAVDLRRLQCLARQARKLGVAADALEDVRPALQHGVRRRARSTIDGRLFEEADKEQLRALANGSFDLSQLTILKAPARWRGHRAGASGASGAAAATGMLQHNRSEIKEALTRLPAGLEAPAVQAFRNILGWMHDKPTPELQRPGLGQDIVDAAKKDRALADEVYVQAMKQLSGNPSPRSMLLGWQLLLRLCQEVCPGNEVLEFLRSFLLRATVSSDAEDGEIVAIAQRCIADLNLTAAPEKLAQEGEDLTTFQVLLIDGSSRCVVAPPATALAGLGWRLAEQLRLAEGGAADFSFYQVTDGIEAHRLLPDSTVANRLFEKWVTLKEMTGRQSRLLWKRRFIRRNEQLRAGDLMHATLTYRQVLWDYLHHPVPEDSDFLAEVAATLVNSEWGHYRQYIVENRLGDPGVLEPLLPDFALQRRKRQNWVEDVLSAHARLWEGAAIDPREAQLPKMGRLVSLAQRMSLFGTNFWLARQAPEVPPEKVSVPDAPSRQLLLRPEKPHDEYWVCLDVHGVRFVAAGVNSGPREFERAFRYGRAGNADYVIRVGARQNVVTFVVSAAAEDSGKTGGARSGDFTIAMLCPAAADVAYMFERTVSEEGPSRG